MKEFLPRTSQIITSKISNDKFMWLVLVRGENFTLCFWHALFKNLVTVNDSAQALEKIIFTNY
jgi:hypothetical protein